MLKQRLLYRLAVVVLAFSSPAYASSNTGYWNWLEGMYAPSQGQVVLQPDKYKVLTLDQVALQSYLSTSVGVGIEGAGEIMLPTPDGQSVSFKIWNNTLIPAALQARYPSIHSYTAVATGNSKLTARIDYTENGFHAMVMGGDKTYFIDPYSTTPDGYYIIYYKSDYRRAGGNYMSCLNGEQLEEKPATTGDELRTDGSVSAVALKSFGTTRKTYRLALSCTGEYAAAVGGTTPTKASVLSAMTTTINRVNGIYEREVAVTLQFIDNQDTLIYLSSSTDPFTANFSGPALLGQNQDNTDEVIGEDAYDIGHIFSTGGGGVASLGSVCATWGVKAQGVTGSASPVGDAYDVDYVAHEVGHQFGAEHTFNDCSGNESITSAYEPGSGSTIMAYAGICGPWNNVQRNSDDYFHARSLDQISEFLETGESWGGGASCGTEATGAATVTIPSITASYEIPYRTPFEIEAPDATPAVSGTITYCWEQYNLGDLRTDDTSSATFTSGPSLRSYDPVASKVRIFPNIDSLLNNTTDFMGERLSQVARSYRFILTARELGSDAWGTFSYTEDYLTVNAANTGAPFQVLSPNGIGTSWKRGTIQTVTWDVASTDIAPISTSNVNIYLSVDGGYTFPYTLAENVANDGSASVTIPSDITTSTARIKVKGAGNIFFDINDLNFEIGDTTVLSLKDTELENELSLYPNPATNTLNVEMSSDRSNMSAVLYNSIGQKVWEGRLSARTQISVATFARGVYFLNLVDGRNGARAVKRVVLQ